MNNERPAPQTNVGCSSDETNTSLSSGKTKKNQLPSHVVNFKESRTHLFYIIQSNDEGSAKTQRFIRIKVSKERPTPKKFVSRKMLVRYGKSDDVTDDNQGKTKTTSRSNLTSIHKRTDHPSFVVLPEVTSKRHGNIERNQSTSENSNETYVVRPKEGSKILGSRSQLPFGPSLWNRNSQRVEAALLHGLNSVNLTAKQKSDDYCECNKVTAGKSESKCNPDLLNSIKNRTETIPNKASPAAYLTKDDLFNIQFVEPSKDHMPQRLRAGQDRDDRRYKSCHMCPDMTRIFPPTSSRRHTGAFQPYYSDASLNKRSGHVKINFKLVRQCLISAKPNEKCEVLDAIRLRLRAPDFNLAMNTIEEMVKFDLFGVQCECRSKPLLEELFWPVNVAEPYRLQTSIAQFVNALVCYKVGRSYFNNRSIIRTLTWGDIGRDNIDPIMGDNLIGIMMKLSCSRFQRYDMIENGLVRWLLQRMEEDEYSASKYRLQCMAGLLRNLLRGYNLEDLSPIEMQKLIVLLGRYLDTENIIAKRYICDSLLTLFQSTKNVTSAKELNFQRIIEEHVKTASHPKQKEHLRAVYQLLNRSATSNSFNRPKFDSQSEEDPFLDLDLESDFSGEIDYYPGECLLREKFSDEVEMERYDQNTDEPAIANDPRKDGTLVSRVFVEHLNSFLPNIEKNRIFPLCNARCADKIKTCSHIGDVQSKRRQPYIPPNLRASRLPRQLHSDSVEGVNDKLKKKSERTDKQSNVQLTSKISTITNDESAARWDHYEDDGGQKYRESDTGTMERIFIRHSMTTVEATDVTLGTTGSTEKERKDTDIAVSSRNEEVERNLSYNRKGSSESADKLIDKGKNDGSASEKLAADTVAQNDRGIALAGGITSSEDYLGAKEELSTSGTKNVRAMAVAGGPLSSAKATKSEEDFPNAKGDPDLLNRSKSVGALRLTRKNSDCQLSDERLKKEDLLDPKKVLQSKRGDNFVKSESELYATQKADLMTSSDNVLTSSKLNQQMTSSTETKLTKRQAELPSDAARKADTKITTGSTGKERMDADLPVSSKGEEITRTISYQQGSSESTDKLNDTRKNEKNEKRQSTDAKNVTREMGGRSSSAKTSKSEEDFRSAERGRDTLNSKSADAVLSLSKLNQHKPDERFEDVPSKRDSETDKVSDSTKGRNDRVHPIARHHSDNSITQQSMAATKLTEMSEKKFGRGMHARSEETFTHLRQPTKLEATKTTQKIVAGKDIGSELPARSEKIFDDTQTTEEPPTRESHPPLSKLRSEETMKKSPVSTVNPASEATKTHQLHARSLEKIGHSTKFKDSTPRSRNRKSNTRLVGETDQGLESDKVRPIARRFSVASATSQHVKQTGNKSYAKSAENLANLGTDAAKLSSSFMEVNETEIENFAKKGAGRELQAGAGSKEMLNHPNAAEKSLAGKSFIPHPRSVEALTSDRNKLATGRSNQPIRNARSVEALLLDENNKPSPLSTVKAFDEATNTKQLHARSAEALKQSRDQVESPGRTVMRSKCTTGITNEDADALTVLDDSVSKGGRLKEMTVKDRAKEDMADSSGGKSTGKDHGKIAHLPATLPVIVAGKSQAISGKTKPNLKTGERSSNALSEEKRDNQPLNARSEDVLNQKLHSKSAEALNKDSKSRAERLMKSTSETALQGESRLADKTNIEVNDPSQSVQPAELQQKDIGQILHARSKEMLTKPKFSPTTASKKTNYLLLSSNASVCSTRNEDYAPEPPEKLTEEQKLFPRSLELVNFKQRGRTQSATAVLEGLRSRRRLHTTGMFSGYSSRSTRNNSSKGCVDCGDGYVLRARPSQPCDQCKASLTKYPNFVEALSNDEDQPTEDYQSRNVKHTIDQSIKVTWVNKTEEKLTTKPNQGKLQKRSAEKLDQPKIDGKSAETRRDGFGAKQNSSSPNDQSSTTARSANETKDNINLAKSLMDEGNPESHSSKRQRQIASSGAGKQTVDVTVGSTRSVEAKPIHLDHKSTKPILGLKEDEHIVSKGADRIKPNRKLKTDETKKRQPKESIGPQPTSIPKTNDKSAIDSISNDPPVLQMLSSERNKRIEDEVVEPIEQDGHSTKREHLLLARSLEMRTLNLNAGRKTYNGIVIEKTNFVEDVITENVVSSNQVATVTNSNQNCVDKVKNDLTIGQLTKPKEQAIEKATSEDVADLNALNNLLQSNGSRSEPAQKTTLVHSTNNDERLVRILEQSKSLSTECTMLETDRLTGTATSTTYTKTYEAKIGLKSDEKPAEERNSTQLNDEATNSGEKRLLASGMESKISETAIDTEVIRTESDEQSNAMERLESTHHVTRLLQGSSTSASSARTTNAGIDGVKSNPNVSIEVPQIIDRVKSTPRLLSSKLVANSNQETPLADPVAETLLVEDSEKLNESEGENIMGAVNKAESSAEDNVADSSKPEAVTLRSSSMEKMFTIEHTETMYSTVNVPTAQSEEENLMNESTPNDHQESMFRQFPSDDVVMPNVLQSNQIVRATNDQVLAARPMDIVKGGILIGAGVIGGRLLAARSLEIFRGEVPAANGVTSGRLFAARLMDVARSELASPQLQKAMMTRMRSTETDEQSSNSDRTEIMELNGHGLSLSTNEAKLGGQRVENSTCDRVLPDDTKKQQNPTVEPVETVADLNLESVITSQNLPQTFVQPLQEEQLSRAEANDLQLKSEDKILITESTSKGINHQLPMAQQKSATDPVILAAPQNNQISMTKSLTIPNQSVDRIDGQDQILAARSLDNVMGKITIPMEIVKSKTEIDSRSLGSERRRRQNLPQKRIQPLQEDQQTADKANDLQLQSENEISIHGSIPIDFDGQNMTPVQPIPSEDQVVLDIPQIPPLSVSLEKQNHSTAACRTNGQVLPARSLDATTMCVEAVKSKTETSDTTKTNLLSVRSNELVLADRPMRKRKRHELDDKKSESQAENDVLNKLVPIIKDEAMAKQGSEGIELTDSSVRNAIKSIGSKMVHSKMSIVSNEVLMEERNLSAETQTKRMGAGMNRESIRGDFYLPREENEGKDVHKVRIVSSTCCRQLLNNEELINRLSEKVLEKLFTEIHSCGPNCKSPCGGFNSYYGAENK